MKGVREAESVPLSTIDKVPLYFFVAEQDNICPMEQAVWTAQEIGPAVKEIRVFDYQDHGYFTYSLDSMLMDSLLNTLDKKELPDGGKRRVNEHWEALE